MLYQQLERSGIGATSHVIRASGKTIVGDHGVELVREPKTGKNISVPPPGDFLRGEKVDAVILTHSHLDHVGAIPALVANNPEAVIFATAETMALSEIILRDSLKISENEARNAMRERRESLPSTFNWAQLENFLRSDRIFIVELGFWYDQIPGLNDWEFGFVSAGHHKGAMSAAIIPPSDRPIILTGDISRHPQHIVPGAQRFTREFFGDLLGRKDLVFVTEATNGARRMERPRQETEDLFVAAVQETQARGGIPLIASFAQQRASEAALILIGRGIVPHIDGLARDCMREEIPNLEELISSGKIIFFEKPGRGATEEERKTAQNHRELVARGEDPCGIEFAPIISPSATMDKGWAVDHATRILPGRENSLIFLGHMFEGSAGKDILENRLERGHTVWLDTFTGKRPVNVRCEVKHFDLSAHDYQPALLERIEEVRPETLIVHHAPPEGWEALSKFASELPNPPAHIEHGAFGNIINL